MDYLSPPMFDGFNIDMWKFKLSFYLKALGLYVYLATTKWSYIDNSKYLEANPEVLKKILNNDYLFRVVNCDFVFAV